MSDQTKRRWPYLVYGALTSGSSNKPGAAIGLTVRFGIESIPIWRFGLWPRALRFGIREANLVFRLSNVKMPDEDWAIDSAQPQFQAVSRTQTHEENLGRGSEVRIQVGTNGKSTGGISPTGTSAGAELGFGLTGERKDNLSGGDKAVLTDTFQFERRMITPYGGPDNPCWNIRTLEGLDILEGTAIKTAYFARAVPNGSSPMLELALEVPRTAVRIEDETGAFTSENKKAIARLRIEKALCGEPTALDTLQLPESVEDGDGAPQS